MKKKLISISITCVIIAVLTILAIKFGGAKDTGSKQFDAYRFDSDISTDPQTINNGVVSLTFYPDTTDFVFTDKFGNEWTAFPKGHENSGYDILRSLLYVDYKNYNGQKNNLTSYADSVLKGNYTYEVLSDQNTIRIDFTIGLISKTYFIPAALPESRYMEFREKNTDDGKKHMRDWYRKYDPEKLKDGDQDTWKQLCEKYPDLEQGIVVYELFSNLRDYQKEFLEDEFAAMGYTRDDYEADLEYATSDEEHDLQPTVNVSLYLKLDGESLVAEVPYDEMKYYSEFPITGLRILPFMCSSGLSDEGFLFVPDGSGATINFNNGKTSSSVFSAPVYGWDYGQMRKEVVKDSAIRFPVYGISFKNRNASLLCMIEEGDSYATIEADIAGKSHDFNFVNSQFLVVHNDLADIAGRSVQDIYIYESKLPAGEKLKLRFTPVNSSDYVDMAKSYHDYLAGKYPELAQKVTKTGLPTAVEMVGSIIKVQHILGFPKELPYALTTYDEMGDILGDLHDSGWEGINVVLSGWFNRGVVHDWPDDIDLIRKLGRKKDFKNLLSKLSGYGYSVSGKANFQFVHNNKLLDGFVAKSDAARYLSREVAEFYPISDVWYGEIKEKDAYYYAKPSYSMKALNSYLKDADKLGIRNIAFETIGNTLGSDYHPRTGTSRQANKNLQEQKLAELKDRENVIYNGNAYAVPYSDLVIDFPIHAGGTSIEDDSIPFFPIALHGYVRYTGDSVNITNDYIMNLLHSAETGAGLYFIFMEADSDELQESEFTYFFGAKYDSWKDSAKEVYNRYKADFGGLVSETIEDHTKIDDGVFVTEYSDGTLVYVNYRTLPYTTNGVTIPAQDWVIGKKGGK